MEVSIETKEEAGVVQTQVCGDLQPQMMILLEIETSAKTIVRLSSF